MYLLFFMNKMFFLLTNRLIGESLCKPRAESNLFELCRGAAKLHEGVARIIGDAASRPYSVTELVEVLMTDREKWSE